MMTLVGSYDLGAVAVGSEASHSSLGALSPRLHQRAPFWLSCSGFGDHSSGSRLLGPLSGSGGPSGNRCEASMAPGLYSSLGPLVQKGETEGLIGWDHLIQLPLYHYLEGWTPEGKALIQAKTTVLETRL